MRGEIAQAHCHVGVAAAQGRLADGKRPAEQRLRLVVEPEAVEDCANAVQAVRDERVAGTQGLLATWRITRSSRSAVVDTFVRGTGSAKANADAVAEILLRGLARE